MARRPSDAQDGSISFVLSVKTIDGTDLYFIVSNKYVCIRHGNFPFKKQLFFMFDAWICQQEVVIVLRIICKAITLRIKRENSRLPFLLNSPEVNVSSGTLKY